MFNVLGKVLKGAATFLGLGIAAGGTVLTIKVDPNSAKAIEHIVTSVPAVFTAIGAILAAFGIGRKAGYAVTDSEK